jgi:hypothetical protein
MTCQYVPVVATANCSMAEPEQGLVLITPASTEVTYACATLLSMSMSLVSAITARIMLSSISTLLQAVPVDIALVWEGRCADEDICAQVLVFAFPHTAVTVCVVRRIAFTSSHGWTCMRGYEYAGVHALCIRMHVCVRARSHSASCAVDGI